MIDDGLPPGDPKDHEITRLRAENESKNEQFQKCARKMEAEMNALAAENERLKAALSNIRHKRREMDMGDLSADEAVWEADAIARAALTQGEKQ